jgi:sulfate permease, SulP family
VFLPNILNLDMLKIIFLPAFTIALIIAIESIFSAEVADSIIGDDHHSDMELIALGIGNILTSFLGGIPISGSASGSLANIKSGGRTPVASIFYAFALMLTIILLGKWTSMIPLSCIAGILVVVAINLSEYQSFFSILRGQRSDAIIMIFTFLITVLIDLTLALEIGMVLAAFLFMRRMARIGKIDLITQSIKNKNAEDDEESTGKLEIPAGVEIYELSGPFFFGIAYRFKETLKSMSSRPKILVIRMRNVPMIDATGIHNLKETIKFMVRKNIKVVLSGVQPQLNSELEDARITHLVGEKNILPHISEALLRVNEMLTEN